MNWKTLVVWLVIFVIGSLIVTFLVSPNSFSSFKSNVKSIIPSSDTQGIIDNAKSTEDQLIKSCINSFKDCKEVTETKYGGASLSIVKIEKFTDINSSMDFYNTWRSFTQPSSLAIGEEAVISHLGLPYPSQLYDSLQNKVYRNGSVNDFMPFVLIVSRVSRNDAEMGEISATQVVACDKNGKLTNFAKNSLLCG